MANLLQPETQLAGAWGEEKILTRKRKKRRRTVMIKMTIMMMIMPLLNFYSFTGQTLTRSSEVRK